MDRLTALLAFAALGGFLAILAIEVPSPDLIIVLVITVLLVAYDFLTSSGSTRK